MPGPLTSIALIAAVFFMLGSVGSPLLGQTVYASTDELSTYSPYYDAGLAGTVVQNTFLDDIMTAQLPAQTLYAQSVRHRDPAGWNPYISGGVPLGSVPSYALWSPLSVPYYVLPAWLAPGYERLLELACAVLGGFLFLRRIRLRAPAAVLGGTVYASSGFMDMWINFPQTRVAAFIPWVFWAAERLVQRRRLTDGVLLALPIAFMLLAGFPAVTGWALLTAAIYLLARAIAEYRRQMRRLIGVLAGGAGAVFGGVGLAAAQLLPFIGFYRSWLIEGRGQEPGQHLGLPELVTMFAPWTFGDVSQRPGQPNWYLPNNMVEAFSYLGAAAVVLVVVALAAARAGRTLLPRGVWVFLVASAASWLTVIYFGGPLRYLQELPVFGDNFIGRARSILFFPLAMLAAVGFELLLRGRKEAVASHSGPVGEPVDEPVDEAATHGTRVRRGRRWRLAYGVAVWVAVAAAVAALCNLAVDAARKFGPETVSFASRQMWLALVFAGLAILAAACLYWAPARGSRRWTVTRFGASVLLIALVAVQALTLAPYASRADKRTFYPSTDVQKFLQAHLGHERFAGTWAAMPMGADTTARLRALTGHAFINANLAALVRGVPGDPIPFESYLNFSASQEQAASPVLDRLATRYFITSPRDPIFGPAHNAVGDGTTVVLNPGQTFTVPVPQGGPLRGIGITPTAAYPPADDLGSRVAVVIKNAATGAVVAGAHQITANKYIADGSVTGGITPGKPFLIPVPADSVPAGTPLVAEFTMHTAAPLTVAAAGGVPAISTVAGADDGLRLVHVGAAVVYQRLTALARIRWASTAVVQPDQQARVKMLASGNVGPDQVVLNDPSAPVDGKPATVSIVEDGTDTITAKVDAQGAGYLVVADADQVGWVATVDGRPAKLTAADQGVVAVRVGAGAHTVTLHFEAPYGTAGAWISALTALVLLGMVGADRWLRARAALQTPPHETPAQHETPAGKAI